MSYQQQSETRTGITPADRIRAHLIERGAWVMSKVNIPETNIVIECWRVGYQIVILQSWTRGGGYIMFVQTNNKTIIGDKAVIDLLTIEKTEKENETK